MAGGFDGVAVGLIGAGALIGYAGLKGLSIPSAIQAVIQGKSPGTAAKADQITGSGSSGSNGSGGGSGSGSMVSGGSAQAVLQQTAAQFGWGSGPQWQALQNVELAEAGFNPASKNPSSGAYGLAQALGHGNANTACPDSGVNEYGGYGLSDAQAQAANCGDAGAQALWMCNYIAQRYGDPAGAWAHEQSNGWY